jgi:hypothetical protein
MPCESRIEDEISGCAVQIEDDDKTAYAYLLDPDGNIVADVWLYNVGPAPLEPEWRDPQRMPFANPRAYAREAGYARMSSAGQATALWAHRGTEVTQVEVYLHGARVAMLRPGAKPGWSALAVKDGPLARMLI